MGRGLGLTDAVRNFFEASNRKKENKRLEIERQFMDEMRKIQKDQMLTDIDRANQRWNLSEYPDLLDKPNDLKLRQSDRDVRMRQNQQYLDSPPPQFFDIDTPYGTAKVGADQLPGYHSTFNPPEKGGSYGHFRGADGRDIIFDQRTGQPTWQGEGPDREGDLRNTLWNQAMQLFKDQSPDYVGKSVGEIYRDLKRQHTGDVEGKVTLDTTVKGIEDIVRFLDDYPDAESFMNWHKLASQYGITADQIAEYRKQRARSGQSGWAPGSTGYNNVQ